MLNTLHNYCCEYALNLYCTEDAMNMSCTLISTVDINGLNGKTKASELAHAANCANGKHEPNPNMTSFQCNERQKGTRLQTPMEA